MRNPRTIKQCEKCPWRVATEPHEIPNGYSVDKHKALSCTIANPGDLHGVLGGVLRVMACHDSKTGKEHACAGWLANQLGPGNNIALRMRVMSGAIPCPDVDGEQHRCFEDTLP
jgi:hypothetical protein